MLALSHLKMELCGFGITGCARHCYDSALVHRIARIHEIILVVRVYGIKAVPVLEDDDIAVSAHVRADIRDLPCVSRLYRRALGDADVNAVVPDSVTQAEMGRKVAPDRP